MNLGLALTGRTRNVQCCQERVDGGSAWEEDGEDLRCPTSCFRLVGALVLIERLYQGAAL
jgi:hypothetical protein